MYTEFGFWVSLGLMIYVYIGYPVALFLLGGVLKRNIRTADITPRVTVLIAAFNEEQEIGRTIINKLEQSYPADCLDVIVVSDGSTDRTDEITREIAKRSEGRLRFIRQEPRQGKTRALNIAAGYASGEVLVFSDANSIYETDAIRQLMRNFSDPSVGYVTGRMDYTNIGQGGIGNACSSYMDYENLLRKLETRVGSVVGADGGIDAIRRELYFPMRQDQLPDFVLPLTMVERGKRVVYESRAILHEPALSKVADELRMRVRVALRALWTLRDKRTLFNPLCYPLFSWQLLSHKALRYGMFMPLIVVGITNLLLIGEHWFYFWALMLQFGLYGLALLGLWTKGEGEADSVWLKPYYFMILNTACAVAFWKFVKGEKMVLWKPRTGS